MGSVFVTGLPIFLFRAKTRQETFLSSEGEKVAEVYFKLKYLIEAQAINTAPRPLSATLVKYTTIVSGEEGRLSRPLAAQKAQYLSH